MSVKTGQAHTYVDPGIHAFVIKAVDGSGNRSGPSNAFTVQIC